MSHDFDDELDRLGERRSRKNPRNRGLSEKELKVLEDAAVYPFPDNTAKAAADTAAGSLPPNEQGRLIRRRRRRRLIAMIAAECLALIFIFGYAYAARRLNLIQRPEINIEKVINTDLNQETIENMKGYWTIAIFGVDARDKAIVKGTNADVNLICNINRDTGEIKLVSVFRDTYLNINTEGSYNKINQAYFVGGPEQAMAALNRNLDLNITEYMTFNWKAVADAIDILGGVDIELSNAEFYYINSFITETAKVTGIQSKHLSKAGMNHLDGVQAVAYGRLRLMDTDFARTERQRKVIMQAFEKAKKADFNTLNTIIGTVFPQIATNIGVDELVTNARSISKYHIGETTGFPQARGDANMPKKGACVIPKTLESNVIQLHTFLFSGESYTPSATVKTISSKISADSGMYQEGKYIDKVTTEGGVIQKPKTTAEQTKESTKPTDDENEETSTDENGDPIETTKDSVKPGSKPTAVETDENGDPVETESSSSVHPGQSSEAETTKAPSRPGETTTDVETKGPAETTTAAATAIGPGETTTAAESTAGTTAAAVPNFPGGTAETIGNDGPGGQSSNDTGVTTIIGTVEAPGQ